MFYSRKNRKIGVYPLRGIAFFSFAMLTGSWIFPVPQVYSALLPQSRISKRHFLSHDLQAPAKVSDIRVSSNLAAIHHSFQGNSEHLVILIRDAHAEPDGQFSIRGLLGYLADHYGICAAGVEGAEGTLDPVFLRAFPEKEMLAAAVNRFTRTGELSGAAAAALLDPADIELFGLEKWPLYESGISAYREAMVLQKSRGEALARFSEEVRGLKEKFYSEEAWQLDQRISAWESCPGQLYPLLEFLWDRKKMPPDVYPNVFSAYRALEHEQVKTPEDLGREVLLMAAEVRRALKAGGEEEALKALNRKFQEFQTGEIQAAEFADFLKALSADSMISERLEAAMDIDRLFRGIHPESFLGEIESLVAEVKMSLLRSPEAQSAARFDRQRYLLARLLGFQLTRPEWEEFSALDFEPEFPGRDPWDPFIRFYEIASEREEAFKERILEFFEKRPEQNLTVVAGGFHAPALRSFLEAQGISYVEMTPVLRGTEGEVRYARYMDGDVSWRSYLKPEKGRVNLHDAFARAVRDELVRILKNPVSSAGQRYAAYGSDPRRMIRAWRDELLRALADTGRIHEAFRFMPLFDEALAGEVRSADLDVLKSSWLGKLAAFEAGVRDLERTGNLDEPHLARLLNSGQSQFPCALPLNPLTFVSEALVRDPRESLPETQPSRAELRAMSGEEGREWRELFKGPLLGPLAEFLAASPEDAGEPVSPRLRALSSPILQASGQVERLTSVFTAFEHGLTVDAAALFHFGLLCAWMEALIENISNPEAAAVEDFRAALARKIFQFRKIPFRDEIVSSLPDQRLAGDIDPETTPESLIRGLLDLLQRDFRDDVSAPMAEREEAMRRLFSRRWILRLPRLVMGRDEDWAQSAESIRAWAAGYGDFLSGTALPDEILLGRMMVALREKIQERQYREAVVTGVAALEAAKKIGRKTSARLAAILAPMVMEYVVSISPTAQTRDYEAALGLIREARALVPAEFFPFSARDLILLEKEAHLWIAARAKALGVSPAEAALKILDKYQTVLGEKSGDARSMREFLLAVSAGESYPKLHRLKRRLVTLRRDNASADLAGEILELIKIVEHRSEFRTLSAGPEDFNPGRVEKLIQRIQAGEFRELLGFISLTHRLLSLRVPDTAEERKIVLDQFVGSVEEAAERFGFPVDLYELAVFLALSAEPGWIPGCEDLIQEGLRIASVSFTYRVNEFLRNYMTWARVWRYDLRGDRTMAMWKSLKRRYEELKQESPVRFKELVSLAEIAEYLDADNLEILSLSRMAEIFHELDELIYRFVTQDNGRRIELIPGGSFGLKDGLPNIRLAAAELAFEVMEAIGRQEVFPEAVKRVSDPETGETFLEIRTYPDPGDAGGFFRTGIGRPEMRKPGVFEREDRLGEPPVYGPVLGRILGYHSLGPGEILRFRRILGDEGLDPVFRGLHDYFSANFAAISGLSLSDGEGRIFLYTSSANFRRRRPGYEYRLAAVGRESFGGGQAQNFPIGAQKPAAASSLRFAFVLPLEKSESMKDWLLSYLDFLEQIKRRQTGISVKTNVLVLMTREENRDPANETFLKRLRASGAVKMVVLHSPGSEHKVGSFLRSNPSALAYSLPSYLEEALEPRYLPQLVKTQVRWRDIYPVAALIQARIAQESSITPELLKKVAEGLPQGTAFFDGANLILEETLRDLMDRLAIDELLGSMA